ncbi:MAG: hypothetical protein PHF97_12300 [Bacteroidales bacterium]|nr:hypothetical protein [Bacteroidales bacterium]MDD4604568.1 hypothetical protein [Bacteroidales bacterium]
MKKTSLFFLLFFLILQGYPQESTIQNLPAAVSGTLTEWLEKIPAGSEGLYGFQNRSDFSRASLGVPVQVFTLNDDFFTHPGTQPSLKSTGEWRIPVVIDHENCALVTVVKINSDWKIVDLGAHLLAQELAAMQAHFTPAQFNEIKLFRVYPLQSDFLFYADPLAVPCHIALLPLHSATLNIDRLNETPVKTRTLDEVAGMIRETLSTNKSNR